MRERVTGSVELPGMVVSGVSYPQSKATTLAGGRFTLSG